jgi:hypothetical protein
MALEGQVILEKRARNTSVFLQQLEGGFSASKFQAASDVLVHSTLWPCRSKSQLADWTQINSLLFWFRVESLHKEVALRVHHPRPSGIPFVDRDGRGGLFGHDVLSAFFFHKLVAGLVRRIMEEIRKNYWHLPLKSVLAAYYGFHKKTTTVKKGRIPSFVEIKRY